MRAPESLDILRGLGVALGMAICLVPFWMFSFIWDHAIASGWGWVEVFGINIFAFILAVFVWMVGVGIMIMATDDW